MFTLKPILLIQFLSPVHKYRLAKYIFDGEDFTKEINEISIDLQFKYWSELISKPSIPFNHSFVNNSNACIHPITISKLINK